MMIFDGKSAIVVNGGLVSFAVGTGPCCEGKFDLMVQEDLPKDLSIEKLKIAHMTISRADLIKLKTIIDKLLADK